MEIVELYPHVKLYHFFNVKRTFLVMLLQILLPSVWLLRVCFAYKFMIAMIMATIELFSTRPSQWGSMRQSCTSNLLSCMASTFNRTRGVACWHNSRVFYYNHLPLPINAIFFPWLGNYCVWLHVVVSLPCWQPCPQMTATAASPKGFKQCAICAYPRFQFLANSIFMVMCNLHIIIFFSWDNKAVRTVKHSESSFQKALNPPDWSGKR